MSFSVTQEEEESQLSLLDVLGFPSDHMLFSPITKTLIYTLGSNIIHYNLSINSKTFIQYLSNEILLLKFLDKQQKLLLTIDKSPSPLVCIWELPSYTQIYTQGIKISPQNKFSISNIFLEQIIQDIYLIVITSNLGINYLYTLKNQNESNNKYSISIFKKLSCIREMIYGFKAFYNSNDVILILERNLLYYSIDLENESFYEKMRIDFPFGIVYNSLCISKDVNLVAFLTTKGSCLIYDQNGNIKPPIKPYGQEYFTSCEFSEDKICIGTNHGKIYIYSIYDNKPIYYIHYKSIIKIRDDFQLNSTYDSIKRGKESHKNNSFIKKIGLKVNDSYEYNFGPKVKYISLNQRIDQIFVRFDDNSIILAPISTLISDLDHKNIFNPGGNNIVLYSFNHFKSIEDIIINTKNIKNDFNNSLDDNDSNESQNIIKKDVLFSCSKDQKLIKYNINYETNILSNSFFDLKDILSYNQLQGESNDSYNLYDRLLNGNKSMIYLTVLKYHPLYDNKLFAGDNKGFLYLFDIKENKLQQKKPLIGTYEIVSLEFSQDGHLLSIGFDTGCLIFCDMRSDCEMCLQLNGHYMPAEDSEFRKMNSQIISFCYFFSNKSKQKNCFLYTKNDYLLELSQLYYDRNKLNKKEIKTMKINNQILDIKIHPSENYVLILNATNQILINHILSGKITGVIDLTTKVKSVNNIQIDISGLFLGVICELHNENENDDINTLINGRLNNYKRNFIIIFEIGTGKVKTCINYINPISKIIFDNEGKYLIITGIKGEISLWKLCDSMRANIRNVLDQMKINDNFWNQYEIKYDNDKDFQNEIVNNTDYIINNRKKKSSIEENVKNDNNFINKANDKKDIVNEKENENDNENKSKKESSNYPNNYFRRNRNINESEKRSEINNKRYYNNIFNSNIENNKRNQEKLNINNRSDYINKIYNNYKTISNYDKSKNYKYDNKLKNSNDDLIKRAPLLLDSRAFFKEKNNKKNKYNKNNNNIFSDNFESPKYINSSTNDDLIKQLTNEDKNNDKDTDRVSNTNYFNIDKFKNNISINRINENIEFKEKNNIKDNDSEKKNFDLKLSNIFKNNKNDNLINTSNTSRSSVINNYIKKDKPSKTFDYYLYNENIQNDIIKEKSKHKNKNDFYRSQTNNIMNNNIQFYSTDKNEYKRQKKLNEAMNILLGNYSQSIPLINGNNRLKLKNKSFQNNFISNKGNKSIKIRLSNIKNNDFNFKANSDREINNMKYYKKNNMQSFMNNFEIRKKLRTSNKYPEPEDIDDYLINMKDEL